MGGYHGRETGREGAVLLPHQSHLTVITVYETINNETGSIYNLL